MKLLQIFLLGLALTGVFSATGLAASGPLLPTPPPPPPHYEDLCEGTFAGSYREAGGDLTFQLERLNAWGDLHVLAWWRGGFWQGDGRCGRDTFGRVRVEFYFPNAPVHRGFIESRGAWTVLEGQIDGGYSFRLSKQ